MMIYLSMHILPTLFNTIVKSVVAYNNISVYCKQDKDEIELIIME